MDQIFYRLRWVVYALIVIVAIRVGRYVTILMNDLLSFQVTLYGYMLEGQQAIGSVSDTASNLRYEAQHFFGIDANSAPAETTSLTEAQLASRLTAFAKKISLFSLLIGTILGLITYGILTKIIFGIREHLRSIMTFIQ